MMKTSRKYVASRKFSALVFSFVAWLSSLCVLQEGFSKEGDMEKIKDLPPSKHAAHLPPGFVDLEQFLPDVLFDLRYASSHNFVGRPIIGYQKKRAVLSYPAAKALAKAQKLAAEKQLSLKVYDAYRPQKSVNAFLAWSHDHNDTKMKAEFYPHLSKRDLFEKKYIFERSGHSRGSTVDLTLVTKPMQASVQGTDGQLLFSAANQMGPHSEDNSVDMGTGFDTFDPAAHTANAVKGSRVEQNRRLLVDIMDRAGFDNYAQEWWHFTLRHEPYPTTYFDFDP